MASDFDRDNSIDSIDQLLKGARRSAGAPPGPACLDAEMLAAWADDGLDPELARAVEAHLSTCARCQAMSAAFFASQDVASAPASSPATVVSFKRKPLTYWLPIAGTVAASLAIYVGVQSTRQPPAGGVANPSPAPTQAKTAERLDQVRGDEFRSERTVKPAKRESAGQRPAAAVAAPPPTALGAAVVTPPPAPTPATVPPISVTAASPVVSTAQSVVARDAALMRPSEETRLIAEFSSSDPRDATLSRLAQGVAGGRGRGAVAEASAPATTFWRIFANGAVERSTDRTAWVAVAIDPVPQGLAAGSAPLPNVCWLAGRSGLVLLSTDGRAFVRVTPPTDADLIAVAATSALQASVRAADGRTFTTSDGGRTWK